MNEKLETKDKGSKLHNFGVKTLEKIQKITQSTIVSTIMEGFILIMPIVITSTIFILAAEIAPAFGLKWKEGDVITNNAYSVYNDFCYRMYNLSYGIMGLALTISLASRLTSKIEPKLNSKSKMNVIIICIASVIAYLLFGVPNVIQFEEGENSVNVLGLISQIFGAKGIFISMLTGMTVPLIFFFCYKFNITIRLPKQVPQNISQAFLNIFPLLFTIASYGVLGWVFIQFLGDTMLNSIFELLTPILNGGNSYWFFIAFSFLQTLTWFLGIHVSVWSGISEPLAALGTAENVDAVAQGLRPTNLWPDPFRTGAFNMGGTGAQIAIPLIIILFCKSKQLKTIGLVGLVPVLFQVNEPILFGLPSILNPIMLVPFLVAPTVNTIIGVIFIELFGMNASAVVLPWSMPTFISIPIASSLQPVSFILPLIWFGVSFAVWTPFVIIQDNINYKKEILVTTENEFVDYRSGVAWLRDYMFNKKKHIEIKNKKIEFRKSEDSVKKDETDPLMFANKAGHSKVNILVICIGAGTSAMCAESINVAFSNKTELIGAKASSQSTYSDYIGDSNIIIISPQARSIQKNIEEYANKRNNLIVHQTKGPEFLDLINDKKFAIKKINELIKLLEEKENEKI